MTASKSKRILAVIIALACALFLAFGVPHVLQVKTAQGDEEVIAQVEQDLEAAGKTYQATYEDGDGADGQQSDDAYDAEGAEPAAAEETDEPEQAAAPEADAAVEAADTEAEDATADESAVDEGASEIVASADGEGWSDISMSIVEANGQAIDPVASYIAKPGDSFVIKATTTAPAESFYMGYSQCFDDFKIEFADSQGNLLSAEHPKYSRVYAVSGATPGDALTITMSGKKSQMASDWAGLWFAKDTRGSFYEDTMAGPFHGTAVCYLGVPQLAFEFIDQNDNYLAPGTFDTDRYGESVTSMYLAGFHDWSEVLKAAYDGDGADQLRDSVSGFVAKDAQGNTVGTYNLDDGVVFFAEQPGTYTLEPVLKDGESKCQIEPLTIEMKANPPKTMEMLYFAPVGADYGMEVVADAGYRFSVNGKVVPLMTSQEMMSGFSQLVRSNVFDPAAARGMAKYPVVLDDPAETVDGAVTMKIIDDGEKKDADTASYNDPVKWESVVKVGDTWGFDWVVELRYDTNNQAYPTGGGVQTLFNRTSKPTVKLRLTNGDDVVLTEGTDYTLDSPSGYFEIDKTYVDGQGRTVSPRDFNGDWAETWYELVSSQGAYFLHPYFEKQVITIAPDDEAIDALIKKIQATGVDINSVEIESIVIEDEGTLADSAYTGGYGNVARVLAWGKSRPIYKLSSLEPNENSKQVGDYYLKNSGYSNIGYDSTAVYASSVTMHKVDENKDDLTGAEFKVTPVSNGATNGRVVQGQSDHLVPSHFIPGFAMIRSVPDNPVNFSRRNLTSIGEPATVAISEDGDEVGDEAYLTYAGLEEGTYTISEVKAPTGYKKADDIEFELSAELPNDIRTGYEFCRWTAKVNGVDVPVVSQTSDEYPKVDDDAYQMFSCNSSCIVVRVADEPNNVEVTKEWDDNDDAEGKRPDSVQVQLYSQDADAADKVAYGDPVTLKADEDWTYTYEKLDGEKEWSVEEVGTVEGYTAEVSGSAEEGFTVTNRLHDDGGGDNPDTPDQPDTPDNPSGSDSSDNSDSKGDSDDKSKLPSTGDNAPIALLLAVAALSATVLVSKRRGMRN